MTSTSVPVGVPAWLTRLTALLTAAVPSILAWVDPGGRLPHGAVQASVILASLGVGAAIFLVHLVHSDIHEYGWSMAAASHVASDAEAEFKQLWPQMQAEYAAAKPVVDLIPQAGDVIARVGELEHRLAEQPAPPVLADVVAAVRADLGFTAKTADTPPAAGV